MQLSDGLDESLKGYLGWGKPRRQCFIDLLLGLLRLRQVNLAQLVLGFGGEAQISSRYRRVQRFFREVRFDYDALASLIMGVFDFYGQSYYLTVDRTNWRWGQRDLNILFLAVVYQGLAIPVYWLVLNKRGNSNQRERIALLKRFIGRFGRTNILGVLGDREFIGEAWWQWLGDQRIPYLIRIRENQTLLDRHGRTSPVRLRFRDLKVGQSRCLRKARWVSGQRVWLSGLRLENGELLILAANQAVSRPLQVYALRWQIETLFQALKGRGFNLEATRLTHYARIKKVIALLALGFAWAHKVGQWKQATVKPLRIKSHGRLAQSLFRYGLDELTDTLLHGLEQTRTVVRLLMILLWPPEAFTEGVPIGHCTA